MVDQVDGRSLYPTVEGRELLYIFECIYIVGKRVHQCDKGKAAERCLEQQPDANGWRTKIEVVQAADHTWLVRNGWRQSQCNGHIYLSLHTSNLGTRQWSLQAAIHGCVYCAQPCNPPHLASNTGALSQGFLETATLPTACRVYVQSNQS